MDCVQLVFYKCHEINFKRCGSYINSLYCIQNKKSNSKSYQKRDNKCFQSTLSVVLNHEQIKKDLETITKIQPFIDEYNWEGINYPSERYDWKTFQKNKIVLNILHTRKEKIYIALCFKT